jgi:3-deoxy-D-manno-octulosonic-acid transferase
MWFLYDILMHAYWGTIRILALFSNHKARKMVRGRERWADRLKEAMSRRDPGTKLAWFHCASLGEFEQGRPVIEGFSERNPGWKILLTFFSPSGYEVRKDYQVADWVTYLPMDTGCNARRFVRMVRPDMAIFIKYEFWFRFIDRLYREGIPVYFVSAIFRKDQHFFKWYAGWSLRQLRKVTRFFVQDEPSAMLLQDAGIINVTISGDTRFDRVAGLAAAARQFPEVDNFIAGKPVILAGSTWPADEELLIRLIGDYADKFKFIIAPHEVHDNHLRELKVRLGKIPFIFFSQAEAVAKGPPDVLVIDTVGHLSHLYRHATIAYIGGGFGAGIHNILEAATFGKPVVFGPNFSRFKEANELARLGGAFPIHDYRELSEVVSRLLTDSELCDRSGEICMKYVEDRTGVTRNILDHICGDAQD